ncbi:MAG: rubrerythrin [Lutisporaceae bacterium]
MGSNSLNRNNMMNTRDCLQRAWNNTMELVRDFEMYSKNINDKKVSGTFKKMAEEQGMMAHDLRELFNQYDSQNN